jgi:FeS assembly SUF system regulator
MVRLSKLADYAVLLLAQIVRREGQVSTAAALSESSGLSLPTASKVLKMLTKSGLLIAQRGAVGGYRLSRGPSEITVADIITVMDGPISVTDCAEGSHHICQMENICPMNGHWHKVNRAIKGALSGVTLHDMVADMPAHLMKKPKPARSEARH